MILLRWQIDSESKGNSWRWTLTDNRFFILFLISYMSRLISQQSCTIYIAVWRFSNISTSQITFLWYTEVKLLRKKKSGFHVVIFLLCLIKFIFTFMSTSIAHDCFFCPQAVRREIFGNAHPIGSVWRPQSSVMDFQTAPTARMRTTAVRASANRSIDVSF